MADAEAGQEKWAALLQELSLLAIADDDLRPLIDPDKVQRAWLGEPPASEQEIAAAEARLGIGLPPSYRAFLRVSNGWSHPNAFVMQLAGVAEIGWTGEIAPDLVSGWARGVAEAAAQFGAPPPAPEDLLGQTLLINRPHEMDDNAYIMLNPKGMHGMEMEGWFFSSWNPGAEVHPSFWHLMVNFRDNARERLG